MARGWRTASLGALAEGDGGAEQQLRVKRSAGRGGIVHSHLRPPVCGRTNCDHGMPYWWCHATTCPRRFLPARVYGAPASCATTPRNTFLMRVDWSFVILSIFGSVVACQFDLTHVCQLRMGGSVVLKPCTVAGRNDEGYKRLPLPRSVRSRSSWSAQVRSSVHWASHHLFKHTLYACSTYH